MVLVVLRILNAYVPDVCVVSVVQSKFMALFMVFNFWIGPGLFFFFLAIFNFSLTISFYYTTLELDLFSGAYLNTFTD
jgi:hypothetical protein